MNDIGRATASESHLKKAPVTERVSEILRDVQDLLERAHVLRDRIRGGTPFTNPLVAVGAPEGLIPCLDAVDRRLEDLGAALGEIETLV
jgi:hypothetical protein